MKKNAHEENLFTHFHLDLIIEIQSRLLRTNFNLDDFMNVVVEQMTHLTPATGVVIELVEGDNMVYRAATGTVKDYVGFRLPMENSISGLCVKTQDILCSNDTENDSRVNLDACKKVQARSLIVAPLFYQEKAIGVLKTLSNEPFAFNDTDIQTLQLMCGLLASGIAHHIFIKDREKMDAEQSDFISMVSHELRTPLTSISGSLILLLSGKIGEISDKAKTLLMIANNNSQRLIRLVSEILDIQKLNANKMHFDIKPISLLNILKEAINQNQMYAKKMDVNLELDIKTKDKMINVDTDRFLQIIANLTSNAIKFTPKNGTVIVRVSSDNQRTRVEVIDQGPGIPEEFKTRIFQKFSQDNTHAHDKHIGTGLGLNITKMLVEKFGGKIDFSTSDKGSIFYFDLPIFERAHDKNVTSSLRT